MTKMAKTTKKITKKVAPIEELEEVPAPEGVEIEENVGQTIPTGPSTMTKEEAREIARIENEKRAMSEQI